MANEKKPYAVKDTLFYMYVLSVRFHKPRLVQPLLPRYFDLKIISDLLSDSREA